jgi:hypothetical protein
MATINKRKVVLVIIWDKDTPLDLTWSVKARGYVSDDSEGGGEKLITVDSDPDTFTRADFSLLTGVDIQVVMNEASTAILQAVGSGGGGHTIVDDFG